MPLISVIIPTYNRAKFVCEAINSVLRQSYDDFEILVVDDGSNDNTHEKLSGYGNKIRLIKQERKGVSSARNRGITEAEGKYIAFLDSDDLFSKRKLELQMDLIKKTGDCHICYTNEKWFLDGVYKNQLARHKKYSGWIFERTLPLCIVSPSSVVIERSVINRCGGFDEKFVVCEDYEFWIRLSLYYPFHFIDKPLVIKRGGHSDQLSQKYWGMDRFRVRALEKIITTQVLTDEQRELVVDMIIKKSRVLYTGALKRGKKRVFEYYKNIEKSYLQS
jgi:glycosyltransferase involved in cell wall biosynthesis